jgi:signal transduction histidine kinase
MNPNLTSVQEDASELRARSAPIIERAPLPIVEVQGEAHVVSYVNSAFCRLLGRKREELIGKNFAEIMHGGDKCLPILDQIYETGEAATLAQRDDSSPDPAYWLYAMWPALDANERPVGVIIQLTKAVHFQQSAMKINEALLISGLRQHELTAVVEKWNLQLQAEIAERKRAEQSLHQAQEELQQHATTLERTVAERTTALRETVGELEAFSYSMAHDMRAPLRSMISFSELLINEYTGKLDAKGVDYLNRIARSSRRLDRLIKDVLDYTQVLRGEVKPSVVDLNHLLRDILDIYPDWRPPKAEIQIEGPLPRVLGNEGFLTQAISNLLGNAVKFVAPGTMPRVQIRAESAQGQVRLFFKDNGIGIARQQHGRIFGMFEHLHPVATYEGTGIGLTIARKAVERMGGEIGFDSDAGQGSTFWIQLRRL